MIQSAGEEQDLRTQDSGPPATVLFILVPCKVLFCSVLNLYPHFHRHLAPSRPLAMPHNGHSPSSSTSKTGSDDGSHHMVDQTVNDRKKKNADAQAAFRARRANYIATLEETGQSVVRCAQLLPSRMIMPC